MEKYLFIAFRSREHSIKFYEVMKSHRIESRVINTPKEAEAGCGLSIRFQERNKGAALSLLRRNTFSSLVGMFEVQENGNRRMVRPIS